MASVLLERSAGRRMSNPANRLPPEYDEMQPQDYDPQFTAEISAKMRVPDRIGTINENGIYSREALMNSDLHRSANMSIPDKIVILGQDQSAGGHHLPDLHSDYTAFTDPGGYNPVGLTTPPRVLTLEEQPFPLPRDEDANRSRLDDTSFLTADDKDRSAQMNGFIQRTPQRHHSDLRLQAQQSTPGDHLLIDDEEEDDLQVMRRQIAKLSLHVIKLEEESHSRSQRELVLYPVVIGYLLLQVAKWFLSNK